MIVNGNWELENELNWRLIVTIRQDECPIRTATANINSSVLRGIALTPLTKVEPIRRSARLHGKTCRLFAK